MANENIGSELIADFYDFAGIDHYSSPFIAKENTLDQCVNFVSTGIVGGKKTRPPYGLFLDNPDGLAIRNLMYWVYYNASGVGIGYIIRISGTHFYAYQVGGGATSWGAAVAGFTCTNTTQPFGWAVLNNEIHLCNGVDVYQTWDPVNGFTKYPQAPLVRTMVSYQNRIHGSNVPGNVGRDYFSSVDFLGAPGESTYLTANSAGGAGTITVNDPIFLGGTNPNLSPNAPTSTGMHWLATLGVGTANQETVVITAITGTVSGNSVIAPYTLTIQGGAAQSHTQYDVVLNSDPWYSDNNNASSANFFDPNNIGAISGLDVVNNNLVMHKASGGIYLYNGNTISNPLQGNNPAFNAPGTSAVSPLAIDQINGTELFLNRDGVYVYTGGYPTNISYSVYDFIQNMIGSQYAIAPGVTFNQKYYLAIGNVTDSLRYSISNCILVYDYILNFWETYSFGVTPTIWEVIVDNSGNQQLLFGDSSGNTYQYGIGTANNGVAANAVLQTHYLTWGAPDKTKEWLAYTINTNPGANFQLQAAVDWSNNWQTITSISGFGVSDYAPSKMKNFKSIAFRIVANTVVPMTFYGIDIKINIGSRRQSGRKI